jgi:tRNA 2-thiouridine synthesizing protein A
LWDRWRRETKSLVSSWKCEGAIVDQEMTVDARGLACPIPVIRAKKALESIPQGRLVVLVDEQVAVENITRLAGYMRCSHQCTACEGGFRITIEKPGGEGP